MKEIRRNKRQTKNTNTAAVVVSPKLVGGWDQPTSDLSATRVKYGDVANRGKQETMILVVVRLSSLSSIFACWNLPRIDVDWPDRDTCAHVTLLLLSLLFHLPVVGCCIETVAAVVIVVHV